LTRSACAGAASSAAAAASVAMSELRSWFFIAFPTLRTASSVN
jgi:hypothetical protein